MVRLEASDAVLETQGLDLFQFQNGTIRSVLRIYDPQPAPQISIPKGYE